LERDSRCRTVDGRERLDLRPRASGPVAGVRCRVAQRRPEMVSAARKTDRRANATYRPGMETLVQLRDSVSLGKHGSLSFLIYGNKRFFSENRIDGLRKV